MIPLKYFGNTGHKSSRTIFGAAALWSVTQEQATRTLDTLFKYGVNHIDTAASYGDAEKRIGPWMREHRKKFFLATKTDKRTYHEAKEELYRSLEKLKVDSVDLWQMHNLVNPEQRELALSSGGAIDAFVEAREQGLIKFIGVTGHGLAAPSSHLKSLSKFKFDSVLLPYNYIMMQDEKYRSDFNDLEVYCVKNNAAIQTIKSISKGGLGNKKQKYNVWYDPLDNEQSIRNAVTWVLGNKYIFLNTAGDINLLPMVLDAAKHYEIPPDDSTMEEDVRNYNITSLFNGPEI